LNRLESNYGRRVRSLEKPPWLLFILVTVLFALTNQVWDYTVQNRDESLLATRMQNVEEGSLLRRVLFSAMGLCGISLLARRGRTNFGVSGWLPWMIMACVCWAFLSIVWTDDFVLTSRRLVSFGMFCLGALGLSKRLSFRNLGLFMFFSSLVYLAAGIAAELTHGTFDILNPAHRFSGTEHPNGQGVNCSFLTMSSVFLGDSSRSSRVLFYFVAVVGALFVILTKSRTAFACTICALIAYKGLVWQTSKKFAVTVAVVVLVFGSLVVLGESAGRILGQGVLLGRTSGGSQETINLNGRVWLWQECRGYAARHRFIGYGFNGFWTPERIEAISQSQGWTLTTGHSIYVDLILELGVIGCGGILVVLLLSARRAMGCYASTGKLEYAFAFSFLVYYALHGTLESMFLNPGYYAFMSMLVFAGLGFSVGCEDKNSIGGSGVRGSVKIRQGM
jgi:exopolysaccharide production protein ExoQ